MTGSPPRLDRSVSTMQDPASLALGSAMTSPSRDAGVWGSAVGGHGDEQSGQMAGFRSQRSRRKDQPADEGPFLVGRPETAARFQARLARGSEAALEDGSAAGADEDWGVERGAGTAPSVGRETASPTHADAPAGAAAEDAAAADRPGSAVGPAASPESVVSIPGTSVGRRGSATSFRSTGGQSGILAPLRERTVSEEVDPATAAAAAATSLAGVAGATSGTGDASSRRGGATSSSRRRRGGGRGLHDIARDFSETVHKLDPRSMSGAGYVTVKSPQRHVRTRLYFTSESHVHALVNVLRCAAEAEGGVADVLTEEGKVLLGATPELDYCTHIVFRLYERMDEPESSPRRHRAEILFSPGACVDPLRRRPRPPIPVAGGRREDDAAGEAGAAPAAGSRGAAAGKGKHAGGARRRSKGTRLPVAPDDDDDAHADVADRSADDVVRAMKAALDEAGDDDGPDAAAAAAKAVRAVNGSGRGGRGPRSPRPPPAHRTHHDGVGPLRYLAPLPMVTLSKDVSLEQLEALLSGVITRGGDSPPTTDENRKVRQKTPLDMADARNLIAAAGGALRS